MAKLTVLKTDIISPGTLTDLADRMIKYGEAAAITETETEVTYNGSFTLDEQDVIDVANAGGTLTDYLMYLECPDSLLTQDVPAGFAGRDYNAGATTEVKKFLEWFDNHISLKWNAGNTLFYITSDPMAQVPCTGDELKTLIDTFSVNLLTIAEYNTLEPSLH